MINQCSSCGGFCKKSGCERENVKPTPQRTWVGLTDEEVKNIGCLGMPVNVPVTPPQRTWAGLTDEEANELWESTDSDWELMKRTEAKLMDKNR